MLLRPKMSKIMNVAGFPRVRNTYGYISFQVYICTCSWEKFLNWAGRTDGKTVVPPAQDLNDAHRAGTQGCPCSSLTPCSIPSTLSYPVLWIQCGSGSRELNQCGIADSDPGQILPSQKLDFDTKNLLYSCVIKHTYAGKKAFLKGWKSGLFVNFNQFPCSWIWIRIPNRDPDPAPGELIQFLTGVACRVNSEHVNLFSQRDNFWNERFLVERFMLYLRYFT